MSLSLDFHGRNRVGELVSRLSSDVTLIRTMLTQTTTSLLSSLIGLIGSVVILFTLSPTLLLVALLLAPALLAVAIVFGRPLQRVATQVQDSIAHSTATAEEALGGIRVVKSYVREDYENERYGGDLSGRRRRRARGSRCGGRLFGALMGFLGFGAIAVLLWYTGHEVIDGPPVDRDADRVPAVRHHDRREPRDDRRPVRAAPRGDRAPSQRVFEIIDTQPTINDAPDAVDLGPITGRIELDGVSFAYDGDRARPARRRPRRAGRRGARARRAVRARARRRSSGSSRGCGTSAGARSAWTARTCAT